MDYADRAADAPQTMNLAEDTIPEEVNVEPASRSTQVLNLDSPPRGGSAGQRYAGRYQSAPNVRTYTQGEVEVVD